LANLDYLYNPDAAKAHFSVNYVSAKKLGFQVIEHGTILPHKDVIQNGQWTFGKGGIVDSKGKFFPGSAARNGVLNGSYTPPMNQFNTVPKLSFI